MILKDDYVVEVSMNAGIRDPPTLSLVILSEVRLIPQRGRSRTSRRIHAFDPSKKLITKCTTFKLSIPRSPDFKPLKVKIYFKVTPPPGGSPHFTPMHPIFTPFAPLGCTPSHPMSPPAHPKSP